MSPGSDRTFPTKKSLRIWVRNNGHVKRKRKMAYVYPRTVEAAKDPFVCANGKNKMFYLIAINLFPNSKIVKPDESDSDLEDVPESDHLEKEEDIPSHPNTAQPNVLKRDSLKKRTKEVVPKADDDTSEKLVTETTETASTEKTGSKTKINTQKSSSPLVSKPKMKAKQTGTRREWTNLKSQGRNRKNDENSRNCSAVEGKEKSLSQSKSKLVSPNSKNKNSSNNAKKVPQLGIRKSAVISNIVNSMQKVIRNCSETGLISFKLGRQPGRT